MTHPALEPRKRGLGFPVDYEALRVFCHPSKGHPLSRPFAGDGFIWAGNGYIAVRVDPLKYRGSPVDENPTALARVKKLDWSRHDRAKGSENWRESDDRRALLFRQGVADIWHEITPNRFQFARGRIVSIDVGCVPENLLQLVTRLPRAFILASYEPRVGHLIPLLFRFNGGIGMIPWAYGLEQVVPDYTVFAPIDP